jgi:hypothetical protein
VLLNAPPPMVSPVELEVAPEVDWLLLVTAPVEGVPPLQLLPP